MPSLTCFELKIIHHDPPQMVASNALDAYPRSRRGLKVGKNIHPSIGEYEIFAGEDHFVN